MKILNDKTSRILREYSLVAVVCGGFVAVPFAYAFFMGWLQRPKPVLSAPDPGLPIMKRLQARYGKKDFSDQELSSQYSIYVQQRLSGQVFVMRGYVEDIFEKHGLDYMVVETLPPTATIVVEVPSVIADEAMKHSENRSSWSDYAMAIKTGRVEESLRWDIKTPKPVAADDGTLFPGTPSMELETSPVVFAKALEIERISYAKAAK